MGIFAPAEGSATRLGEILIADSVEQSATWARLRIADDYREIRFTFAR